MEKLQKSYDADSIKVLKGLSAVRKRPGMYIGDTDDIKGLHHMLYEVVDNAIDEALAGYCKNITIRLHEDGSASVEDDGRGIPVGIHKEEGISAAEVIMTQLHAGGKFSQDIYKVSGGLHGVGISVVNALSSKVELRIYQNGCEYHAEFQQGETTQALEKVGKTTKRGTYVRFHPDPEIFSVLQFDYNSLCKRFQELAFLNPGIKIIVIDERGSNPIERVFIDNGGVESFTKFLCGEKNRLNQKPLTIHGSENNIEVDCSIFWIEGSYSENLLVFTNTIPQSDGGTHLSGLRSGLTKSFQNHVEKKGTKAQQRTEFTGEDIREGMVCVLSVKVPDPKFSSQTKEKLVSSNVRQVVESMTARMVEDWLEENPADANKVIAKVISSAETREAARRARDLFRKPKGADISFQVSKKLAGCSEKDPSKCQLFIVEGDSAGGSAKQARNRFTQAVLPLRGKILNIEKANLVQTLKSEAISTLVATIGTGIGDDFKLEKLRYHKVVIMTDADDDGKHITALLMTFFLRHMPELIENKHLYLANPPLYGIKTRGGKMTYVRDERSYIQYVFARGIKDLDFKIEGQEVDVDFLRGYCENIGKIRSMFFDPIIQTAISAKALRKDIWTEDGIDHDRYLEALKMTLAYIMQTASAEWYIENDILYSAQYGVAKPHSLKLETFTEEKIEAVDEFISEYEHMWGPGVTLNCDPDPCRNPFKLLDVIMERGKKGLEIQRYKGLGEMPTLTLREEVMEQEQTLLYLENIEEIIEEAKQACSDLMGENVATRKQFIEENAEFAELDA